MGAFYFSVSTTQKTKQIERRVSMNEKEIINQILLLFSQSGDRIFRQNTGTGWAGQFIKHPMTTNIRVTPNDVLIKNARPLRAGLCLGSSDLIGWRKKLITADDIGKTYAIFTALEVKYGKTKTTEEQTRFLDTVRNAGGIGKIIRSIDEVASGF